MNPHCFFDKSNPGVNTVEFINRWAQLGHVLTTDINDKAGIEQRKHSMCGQIDDVLLFWLHSSSLN